jgi:hypothetical protein
LYLLNQLAQNCLRNHFVLGMFRSMNEIKRTDGVPMMRRLGLPPRERRPRNWWKIAVWLVAFFWLWSNFQFTYEIVEIDDGSAPGVGAYTGNRMIDGRRYAARSFIERTGSDRANTILLESVHSWSPRLTMDFGEVLGQRRTLDLESDFSLLRRHCLAVIRWQDGVPTTTGCSVTQYWRTLLGYNLKP